EPAGDERTVHEGEFIGQRDQCRLLRQQVFGVAPVALPAVGGVVRGRAADHVAAAAVVAQPASGDVVDDDPIAEAEPATSRTGLHDRSRRLMTRHDPPVGGTVDTPVRLVFMVDVADVASADARGSDPQQHLARSRLGYGQGVHDRGGITGQAYTAHGRGRWGAEGRCVHDWVPRSVVQYQVSRLVTPRLLMMTLIRTAPT